LAQVRKEAGSCGLAVAQSGIAATLLSGGRTCHFRFKVPIPIYSDSALNVSMQSETAELILIATLIIWDEAPMGDRFILESMDRKFREVMGVDKPFGGKIIILAGEIFALMLCIVVRYHKYFKSVITILNSP
jgi:hypothetical protein